MSNMIVITPNDELLTEEYKGYDSLRDAVKGYIEHLIVEPIVSNIFIFADNPDIRATECIYYCNEEGALCDTGYENKLNAMATIMYGMPIFGAIVAVKLEDVPYEEDGKVLYYEKDSAGFNEEETEYLKNKLEEFFKGKEKALAKLHELWDDYKQTFEREEL